MDSRTLAIGGFYLTVVCGSVSFVLLWLTHGPGLVEKRWPRVYLWAELANAWFQCWANGPAVPPLLMGYGAIGLLCWWLLVLGVPKQDGP